MTGDVPGTQALSRVGGGGPKYLGRVMDALRSTTGSDAESGASAKRGEPSMGGEGVGWGWVGRHRACDLRR